MEFEIRPRQPVLMEGREFTPADLIGTITLSDVDLPNGLQLSIADVLCGLQFKQFVAVNTAPQVVAQDAVGEGDAHPSWYDQHEQNVTQVPAEPTGAESTGGLPIDLPKTVLEQLAKKQVNTLEDASDFLVEADGDLSQLGISQTAGQRLVAQLSDAGLPTGQPSGE